MSCDGKAMTEALDHIIRPALPWRDDRLTECGRPMEDVPHVITRDGFALKYRTQGQQRSALTTCMTCWTTARRWPTWDADPVEVMRRELAVYAEDRDQVGRELRAVAALIGAHRDEFAGLLAGLAQVGDLAARRQAKWGRRATRR